MNQPQKYFGVRARTLGNKNPEVGMAMAGAWFGEQVLHGQAAGTSVW